MRKAHRILAAGVASALLTAALVGLVAARAPLELETLVGREVAVGGGTARLFVELGPHGEPTAVGVSLTETAMEGLAERMNTTSRCFDKDGDGRMAHGECLGDYQSVLELPDRAAELGLPVRWATVNWNPEGHPEPAPPVWSAPHFDFHFFLVDRASIEAIRPGPCGEFIDCEDFAAAVVPLPAHQHPADYVDVGAAVPAMGNHLVDSSDPELLDPSLGFSRTFIFGTFAGRLIFLEPMVSHAYLSGKPDACTAIKAPRSWAVSGYYPTSYCVRFLPSAGEYRISLEGLVHRPGEAETP